MLSGLFKSPKRILATNVAKALAQYFEVDPETVESNLLSDTKIVLHDLLLKTVEEAGTTTTGVVKEVEFLWKWGGAEDGTTSFVRETVLKIRGAEFHVVVHGRPTDARKPSVPHMEDPEKELSYIERHVQQILDHLTLQISDVKVVFHVEGTDDSFVGQLSEWRLLSFL